MGPLTGQLPLADADWVWIIIPFLLFGGGGVVMEIVKNINRTRVEIATLRSQQRGSSGSTHEVETLRQEVAQLKAQVTSLRDTTTQYDLSFDTALHRLEGRVDRVEQQQHQRIGA